jgi:hypothetical protein
MWRALVTTTLLLIAPGIHPALAQEVRLSTENDLITNNRTGDDLYTFSVAVEGQVHAFALSLRENAFTDRPAGTRFDETYLSAGHSLPSWRHWAFYAEAGVVHVGKGLFGQRAQNAVHRAIGNDEVHLRYLRPSLHPRFALAASRPGAGGSRFAWGPRLELDVVPGLRSWALLAAAATWQPDALFALELQLGGRFTHASYPALEPHIAGSAPAARIGVSLGPHLFFSWSYNDYGDAREHVSAGFRFAVGGGSGGNVAMR